MGACVALDQPPQTVWTPPLAEGKHYFELGATTDPYQPLATESQYEQIPERLERFLKDHNSIHHVRASAADYFDSHACPIAVGRYLLAYVGGARKGRESARVTQAERFNISTVSSFGDGLIGKVAK